jgi:spore coat polysaccharide biosynthesis predicted glycosyltransferase SpsG
MSTVVSDPLPGGFFPPTIPTSTGDSGWEAGVREGDIVVFDGYGFSSKESQTAARLGARVVTFDDGVGHVSADVIVRLHGADSDRGNEGGEVVLSGPSYAPVLRRFLSARKPRGQSAGTLVITLGGSDASDLGGAIVDLIAADCPFERAILVRGPQALRPELSRRDGIEVVDDPGSVVEVLDLADAALSAAGHTTWELLTLGVPTALVVVSPNQAGLARRCIEDGVVAGAMSPAELHDRLKPLVAALADPAVATKTSARAMEIVDGRGAARILDAVLKVQPSP